MSISPRVPNPLSGRRPWLAVSLAYGRALWRRHRLPPGDLLDIGELERGHRTLLIDRAARYGPVFKGLMERRLVVCVLGHSLGRRLLKEHAASLRAVSIELESLFPYGFMRGMEGDVHRNYRKTLVRGIAQLPLETYTPRFEAIADQALQAHGGNPGKCVPLHAWDTVLEQIASSALITLFFGIGPGSVEHSRLLATYHQLGPNGVVWNLTPRQTQAYRTLSAEVAALGAGGGGLLGHLLEHDDVDETLIGNLIYMVELGRYDLRGLLRWISRYAIDTPGWLERIAVDCARPGADVNGNSAAVAFVLETLRMDQSERLMREVKRDIVFGEWLIPKGSLVRVCMWEGHKDAHAFPRPFEFDPSRFCGPEQNHGQFSPFGLDHHRCPLSGPVIQIAAAFLRVLAGNFAVSGRGAEPATRGPYHWQPSPGLEITLSHRMKAGN